MLPAAAWGQEDLSAGGPPALDGPSDTLLPRTGVDPSLSDLREHLLNAYGDAPPQAGPPAPNLQFQGQIGGSEEFTSNAGGSAGASQNSKADYISALSPVISIIDTSPRLQASLTYAPIGQLYAVNTRYSQIEENFTGSALATLVPGWLFLDARASIAQSAVFGGVGPSATTVLAPANRETTSSLSLSPYVARSFGGTGTAQIGAGYVYSTTEAPAYSQLPTPQGEPALPGTLYGSSWLATLRGFAKFTTGEDFGRLRNEIGTDDSLYSGSGGLSGGRRLMVTDDASYAITRLVSVLGELGYENLDYPHDGYGYTGPVASGGVKLTPSQGSALTVEYRYVDGLGAAYVLGSVQASPRIRVFGGYSQAVSTFQQDQQNTLLDSTTDGTGAQASTLQAAPLLPATNLFAANQDLSRVQRLNLSASYLGNWDTVTLSLQHEISTPLQQLLDGLASFETGGTFGSISERHDLTPTLSLSAYLQYGSSRTGPGPLGQGELVSVSATLNKNFSDKLSAYLRVSGYYTVAGSPYAALLSQGLTGNQTNVVAGVVRRF